MIPLIDAGRPEGERAPVPDPDVLLAAEVQPLHLHHGETRWSKRLRCHPVSPSDSFMQVGLTRQGVVCEVCGFACHIQCREKVPAACPVPPDQSESI